MKFDSLGKGKKSRVASRPQEVASEEDDDDNEKECKTEQANGGAKETCQLV